jgi:hypothetical protein
MTVKSGLIFCSVNYEFQNRRGTIKIQKYAYIYNESLAVCLNLHCHACDASLNKKTT